MNRADEHVASSGDAALKVEHLTVARGGRDVLVDISFSIRAGQVVALLGPNGAGKTTLMDSIVGKTRPRAGSVRVGGRLVDAHGRWCRSRIGYADQELALFPTLTVWENVWGWSAFTGLAGLARKIAVRDALSAMLLERIQRRLVRELSGGERRRVHCAMAVVARPPILLLDEPTVGVDPNTRRAVLNYVRALAGDGAAICYSTHYLHEVEHLDADVVLLRDGRMLVDGGVGDLIARHGNPVIEIQAADSELIHVPSDDPSRDVPRLLDQFRREGRKLTSLAIRSPTLDDVFDRFVDSEAGTDGR